MSSAVQTRRAPDWLLRGEAGLGPCGCGGTRRKGSFLEKTLSGGAGLLRQVMFSEDVAGRPGLLQRLDPRLKAVSLVVLLVAVGLVHHVSVLVGAYACTLVLAAASKLSIGFFVKRVWLFVPVFTGIVVLPATLSIVTPGEVVLPLWHWHGAPQGFTAQGLTTAALVVSRVATSVSLVVLLTLTTPWTRLLAALRALGVPRIFILIIGMAYRYVFLLLGTVTEMYEARKARTVSGGRHDRAARRFVTASAGALFGRAGHLSEEVHMAMVARGYRGNARTLHTFRLAPADALAAAVVLAAAVAIYGGDLLLGR
ncbi:cobalt ECF transporter T component CbiQ [Planosporangium flavigriseum]|uniref:Cobalt ECF transporter T component CbiQ n=1 Tax=Planosporangium flavigriseum TaxID=373681 RepID=A0A8J3LXI6_9ACTN|nr:cobalt ECF transporter T component CbiQ [Planosporangium flavigriseum]NJC64034.1 cobalt ECF transporter T component CbiQ [Planosporangium flavigriseum]GIG72915.1 cobalt ECF transporter T component CbiQ [Planosporangium flavigriseum]